MSGELPVVDPLEAIADPVARAEFQRLGKRIEDMQSTLADMKGMLSTLLASQNTPSGSGAPSIGGDAGAGTSAGGGHAMAESDPSSVQHGDSGGTMETPPGEIQKSVRSFQHSVAYWRRTGKDIRLATFPKVGAKDAAGMPYRNWRVCVMSSTDAAHVTCVVLTGQPSEGASQDDIDFYEAANALVYHHLLDAVANVSVLSDSVQRFLDMPNSAQLAWGAIKEYFVRSSDRMLTYLTAKLFTLSPKPKETMETFLNRCALLKSEYAQYDLELKDSDLISQVLSNLSRPWLLATGLHVDGPRRSWAEVSRLLQTEDNARKQSDNRAPDQLLPLGVTRSEVQNPGRQAGGQANQAGGSSNGQGSRSGGNRTPSTNASGGTQQRSAGANQRNGQRSRPGSRGSSPDRRVAPRRDQGSGPTRKVEVPPVCWLCLKTGHKYEDCPDKTAASRWTPENRAEADRIRKELKRTMQDGRASVATAAGTQGGASSSGTQTPGSL